MKQHETMFGMPADASSSTVPSIDALASSLLRTAVELDRLSAERRRLAALAEGWAGGHRRRYDELLAAFERRHAQLVAGVDASAFVLRRVREEAAR
jgi:hypothetical protein